MINILIVDKLIDNRYFACVDIFNFFLEKKINTTIICTKFYMYLRPAWQNIQSSNIQAPEMTFLDYSILT